MIWFPGWKCLEPSPSSEARGRDGSCAHSVLPDHPRGKRHGCPRLCPRLPVGRLPAQQTEVNFPRGPKLVPGVSRAVGPVGLSVSPRPAKSRECRAGAVPTSGQPAGLEQRGKAGSSTKLCSQASAYGHCQIFSTSVSYSLPLSLEDRPGPEFLGWGRGAVRRKSQIFERRPSTSKLSHPTGPLLGRISPKNCRPGRALKTRSGGRAPRGASRKLFLPPRGTLHPSPSSSSQHRLKQFPAFSSPLFPPHLDPPLFFSGRLHPAPPLPCTSPPLLYGRPPRQSPPPPAPARSSPPPRFLERLPLPSRAALRFARSRAICQRSRPGGAARPAGARVTSD